MLTVTAHPDYGVELSTYFSVTTSFQGACHPGRPAQVHIFQWLGGRGVDRGGRLAAPAAHCVRAALIVCARLCHTACGRWMVAAHPRRIEVEIQLKAREDRGPWLAPQFGRLAPLRTRRRALPIHRARFWRRQSIPALAALP